MYLFTRNFWAYAFERMAKTFAQVMIAGMAITAFVPTSPDSWKTVLVTAGIASLVSLLTSITAYSAASGTESTPISTVAAKTPADSLPFFTIKS